MPGPSSDAPLLTTRSGRVKTARKLARRVERTEHRLFLAEGAKALEGALAVAGCVAEVFATRDATARETALHDRVVGAGLPWQLVEDDALASLAETVHPQGIVAVCHFVDRPLADVLDRGTPRLVAVCADVRDPGNAGTVIRCADAAGADAVVLAGHSVDPYNPKTVRATVGSLFHLPLSLVDDPASAVATLRGSGLTVLAADGAGEVDLDRGAGRRPARRADGLAVRQRGLGPPRRAGRAGRPPGPDPDPRPRREPEPRPRPRPSASTPPPGPSAAAEHGVGPVVAEPAATRRTAMRRSATSGPGTQRLA